MFCTTLKAGSKLEADSLEDIKAGAPEEPKVRTRSLKMIALSLLIVFVLYGDSLAILSEFPLLGCNSVVKFIETGSDFKVGIGPVALPLPKLVFTFFNGGGVFNRVPDNNIEYAIYGRHVGADPRKPWDDLNYIKSCFPYDCGGEIHTRMEFSWHQLLGQDAYTKAMNNLIVKIKNKYNSEHPQTPVDKVAIYLLWWPRSEDGFYKLRTPDNTSWRLLAEE